jgi:predicted nucleic acid-binding protein
VGAEAPALMRVVLDTNTVISALLFSGTASHLVSLWQSRRIAVLVSGDILQEYLRVLAYPKFKLSDQEIRRLIEEEFLPSLKRSACAVTWPSSVGIPRTSGRNQANLQSSLS